MNKSDLRRFTKAHERKMYILKRFAKGFVIGVGALLGFVTLLLGAVFGLSFVVEYFNIPKPIVPLLVFAIITGVMVGGMFVVTSDNIKLR